MAMLVGRAQNSQLYLFTGQTHSELFLYSQPMLGAHQQPSPSYSPHTHPAHSGPPSPTRHWALSSRLSPPCATTNSLPPQSEPETGVSLLTLPS